MDPAIGKIIFEAAKTYQSYRASLILVYLDARGILLVCILLPGALDLYRDRISSLLESIWVFPQLNISLKVQVFNPGFLLLTSSLFF